MDVEKECIDYTRMKTEAESQDRSDLASVNEVLSPAEHLQE